MKNKTILWKNGRIGIVSLCVIGTLCLSGCGDRKAVERNTDVALTQEVQDSRQDDDAAVDESENFKEHAADSEEESTQESTGKDVEQNTDDLKQEVLNSDYANTEIFQTLYDTKDTQQQPLDFCGEWNRTNVISGFYGKVMISNEDAEGFDFTGEFYYYSHSGEIAGRAYFVTEDIAIYQYEDEFQSEDAEAEFIAFVKTGDGMQIKATGSSSDLGFGMNVFGDGEYTIGEPVYTNENILAETFSKDEISQIEQLLGEEWYNDYFVLPVEEGMVNASDCVLADGSEAVFYDVFWPTMGGYEFSMLIGEDGSIYYYSGGEPGWQTNVPGEIDFPEYELVEQ